MSDENETTEPEVTGVPMESEESERKPFEPLGEDPQWKLIFDLVMEYTYGDLVDYEVFAIALDLDPDLDRKEMIKKVQGAMAAAKMPLADHGRVPEAVKNRGYRITEPDDVIRTSNKHGRKSKNSIKRQSRELAGVDRTEMTPILVAVVDATLTAVTALEDAVITMDRKQRKFARAAKDMIKEEKVQRVQADEQRDDVVSELRARVAALEDREEPSETPAAP